MIYESLRDRLVVFLQEDAFSLFAKFLGALVFCLILYGLIRLLVQHIENKIMQNSLQSNIYTKRIAHLVGIIVFTILMLFVVLIFFEILGISTALLLGGLTIAVGFAMDTTIGNMVSGIMLLSNKKIQVGKSLKLLGSINQIAYVEEFHIRYTVLRNIYKQRIIVPNTILLNTPIQTKKSEQLVRGEVTINLSRSYDLTIVKDILLTTINSHPKILHHEQSTVLIKEFTPKGYELICYYYYSPLHGKKVDFIINSELRNKIKYALEARGMKLTYNRQVLHIDPEL